MTPTIVLPGLDGTDALLDEFCGLAPDSHDTTVWPLPDDPDADYRSLCDLFKDRLRALGSCCLIAESYSGPLGIILAQALPDVVDRLVLVASFAKRPAPPLARVIPWSLIFRRPMPTWVAKRYFVEKDPVMIDRLKRAVAQTSSRTMASRVRHVLTVDVTEQVATLKCPVMYLRPTRDRLVPKRSAATIVRTNPSVVVREIDGPHLILQTRPSQAWAAIRKE